MNQLFTRIIGFIKRLTGRKIQEEQLDELSRTRKLLIALIEKLYQHTINQMTKRWESHAASMEKTIGRLQKEIDQKNKSLLQKLQESVSRRKP